MMRFAGRKVRNFLAVLRDEEIRDNYSNVTEFFCIDRARVNGSSKERDVDVKISLRVTRGRISVR